MQPIKREENSTHDLEIVALEIHLDYRHPHGSGDKYDELKGQNDILERVVEAFGRNDLRSLREIDPEGPDYLQSWYNPRRTSMIDDGAVLDFQIQLFHDYSGLTRLSGGLGGNSTYKTYPSDKKLELILCRCGEEGQLEFEKGNAHIVNVCYGNSGMSRDGKIKERLSWEQFVSWDRPFAISVGLKKNYTLTSSSQNTS